MERRSRSTNFLIPQRAKVCFILFNAASGELQEKQGNFHQKYLCFSSEERWPRRSPIVLPSGEQDFYFWLFSLWKWWASPIFRGPKTWIISLLLPTCFALNITSYISYFPLKTWEILLSFCWLNPLTEVPGDQFLGEKKEYSDWNRSPVPVPIQNKQCISLQTSIIILIYVPNFVYFAILEKKKRLKIIWRMKRNLSIPKETEVWGWSNNCKTAMRIWKTLLKYNKTAAVISFSGPDYIFMMGLCSALQ